MLAQLLVAAHVIANLLWIGSIAAVGWLATRAAHAPDDAAGAPNALLQGSAPSPAAPTDASAAADLYRKVASPAFFASFTAGICRVLLDPAAYGKAHWFHGKLTFAVAVIALHHVVGAKAKKGANVGRQEGKSGGILALCTVVCAAVVTLFAVLKLPS